MDFWDLSATWVLEILSAGVSIASLGAMFGVLAYADGRILVAWNNLTLNTIVSILSTISRLCAIFTLSESIAQSKWAIFAKNARSLLDFEAIDMASRGPMGAFWLLFRMKKIVVVGAIATLLAIVFDPFSQQLVRLEQTIHYTASSLASVPKAQRYSAGNRVTVAAATGLSRNDNFTAVTAHADFSMQSAIFYGLTQTYNEVSQQLQLNCPSGNCTWSPLQSLAICSTCNDIAAKLQESQTSGMSSAALMDTSNAGMMRGEVTKYELANGLSIDNFDSVQPQLLLTSLGTANESETITMGKIDTIIWSMSIIRVGADGQEPTATWPEVPLEAHECALHYCVKEFKDAVRDSKLVQTSKVDPDSARVKDSWLPVQSSVETYQANITDDDIRSLAFEDSLSAIERTDLMLGNGFNISQAAINSLGSFFRSTFSANVSNVKGINGFYMRSDANIQYEPAAIQPLVFALDLEQTFSAVAESMSNAIRAADDDKRVETGMIGVNVTVYRVHWPWIALPVLVVLASIAQLIITIETSKHAPLWKNSSLAVMSRGRYVSDLFEEETATVTAMQNAVGKQRVHLFPHRGKDAGRSRLDWQAKAGPDAAASAVELTRYSSAYCSKASTPPVAHTSEVDLPIHQPVSKI